MIHEEIPYDSYDLVLNSAVKKQLKYITISLLKNIFKLKNYLLYIEYF